MIEKTQMSSLDHLKPVQKDFTFDLEGTLNSIVSLTSYIPEDAFTAAILGTQRSGHGAVISESGLIVTIGYLVAEADQVWITTNSGSTVQGHALAYDYETGFGLVQALGKLHTSTIKLGDSNCFEKGNTAILAAAGGSRQAIKVEIAARAEFAGYWEYLIGNAIYTTPVMPNWGGAALIDNQGQLCGIGSLYLNQIETGENNKEGNLIVPTELLAPILDELTLYGRTLKPSRPWLGMFVSQIDRYFEVVGLYNNGPAAQQGLFTGDIILEVSGITSSDLPGFFKHLWSLGTAGCDIPMLVKRDNTNHNITVKSVDRRDLWKGPRMH
jgi:S1-C subfamily serine protease